MKYEADFATGDGKTTWLRVEQDPETEFWRVVMTVTDTATGETTLRMVFGRFGTEERAHRLWGHMSGGLLDAGYDRA